MMLASVSLSWAAPPIPVTSLNEVAQRLCAMGLHSRAQEELWVVALDGAENIRSITPVAQGTYTQATTSIPAILSPVFLSACDKFLLSHNHPTNDLRPSPQDRDLTRRVKLAAVTCDLVFVGHLILTPDKEWRKI